MFVNTSINWNKSWILFRGCSCEDFFILFLQIKTNTQMLEGIPTYLLLTYKWPWFKQLCNQSGGAATRPYENWSMDQTVYTVSVKPPSLGVGGETLELAYTLRKFNSVNIECFRFTVFDKVWSSWSVGIVCFHFPCPSLHFCHWLAS